MTVFPGIPDGATNKWADSPVLLIHLREDDADSSGLLQGRLDRAEPAVDGMWGNFVAYSKICTHAGCPASLYEQQTNRLLCPCHQSQFLITDQAKPIFGPATRRLPMLPLEVEGGLPRGESRTSCEPVGPAFWERPEALAKTNRRRFDLQELPARRGERRRPVPGRHPPAPGCSTRSSPTTGRSCSARSRCTRSSSCC